MDINLYIQIKALIARHKSLKDPATGMYGQDIVIAERIDDIARILRLLDSLGIHG
jgi:hypothetical protein